MAWTGRQLIMAMVVESFSPQFWVILTCFLITLCFFFFFFLVPIYTLRNTLPQSQLQTICCTQRAYTKPGYSHLTTMKHTKINSDQGRHTQVLRPWTLRSIQSLWHFFSKGKMLLVMLQLWMCSYPAKPCGE